MNILYLIKDYIRSKNLSQFITNRVLNDFYKYNDTKFKFIATSNALYHIDELLFIVDQAINDYNYNDIRSTDIVLDIGACNGGFSMEIHKHVKKVFAIEPIYFKKLNENINLNHATNVTSYRYALGAPNTIEEFMFMGKRSTVKCKSLTELIKICGGTVDVLKLDCEGAEWCIQPHELVNIRRIEAEIHSFNNEYLFDFTRMLSIAGFSINIKNHNKTTMLVSATKI